MVSSVTISSCSMYRVENGRHIRAKTLGDTAMARRNYDRTTTEPRQNGDDTIIKLRQYDDALTIERLSTDHQTTTTVRQHNDDATNDASTTLLSRDVDVRMRHFCASSLMIARKCSFAVLEYLWAQCVFRAIRVGEKVTQNLLGTTLIREFVHVCAFAVLSTTCRR